MKTKSKFLVYSVLFILAFIVVYSCNKDENTITTATTTGLNGKWQFRITPLNDYVDTSMLKGKNGGDFNSTVNINDEIYLYESNNQVTGFSGPFEFRGAKTDSVHLEIFEPADGPYGNDTSTIKSSEMTLFQNSMGQLVGWGKIVLDRDSTGIDKDTYSIYGVKIDNITPDNFKNLKLSIRSSWTEKLCTVASDIISFIVSCLTDGIFRPMSNCWGHKAGGGYYVFGHEGPGSLLPVWTQTVYYPLEWSWCKVRQYDFDINYDGQARSINALKDIVQAEERFYSKLGFHTDTLILSLLEDFYNTYGNFAVTYAYNGETQNAAIYVNVENGSTNAHTHSLIQTIKDFNPLGCELFLSSGRNISDSWHMRRSDFLVCNTALTFCYLFGTANIIYN